jgi:hypothetical protein
MQKLTIWIHCASQTMVHNCVYSLGTNVPTCSLNNRQPHLCMVIYGCIWAWVVQVRTKFFALEMDLLELCVVVLVDDFGFFRSYNQILCTIIFGKELFDENKFLECQQVCQFDFVLFGEQATGLVVYEVMIRYCTIVVRILKIRNMKHVQPCNKQTNCMQPSNRNVCVQCARLRPSWAH